jgi:Domain of unknown function (DUF4129)
VAGGNPRAAESTAKGGQAGAYRYGLPILAGLLLLAVIIGIGATTPAASRGVWAKDGTVVAFAIELPLALLFFVVWLIGKYSLRQGYLARALRLMLQRVIALAMIVIVLLVLVNSLHPSTASTPRSVFSTKHGKSRAKVPKLKAESTVHLPWLPYLLLALLAAVVVVACVVLILRRRQASPRAFREFTEEGEELQRAVESGRSALRTVDNARAAIIACYVAMETSLAGAGTARSAAETPDELLERAAAAGLVHGGAAGRLTSLFYEARFSTHPMPPSARESAREALDELSADLTIEMAYAIRAHDQ